MRTAREYPIFGSHVDPELAHWRPGRLLTVMLMSLGIENSSKLSGADHSGPIQPDNGHHWCIILIPCEAGTQMLQ
jgi:hypothetical protein